jgi:hypothetical protein
LRRLEGSLTLGADRFLLSGRESEYRSAAAAIADRLESEAAPLLKNQLRPGPLGTRFSTQKLAASANADFKTLEEHLRASGCAATDSERSTAAEHARLLARTIRSLYEAASKENRLGVDEEAMKLWSEAAVKRLDGVIVVTLAKLKGKRLCYLLADTNSREVTEKDVARILAAVENRDRATFRSEVANLRSGVSHSKEYLQERYFSYDGSLAVNSHNRASGLANLAALDQLATDLAALEPQLFDQPAAMYDDPPQRR